MHTRHYRSITLLLVAVLICGLLCACGHEHNFSRWEIDEKASCTEDGQKIRSCDCGEEETKVIKAHGHTEGQWITDKDASCTEDGSKHQVCSVCNNTIKTEAIPSFGGHTYDSQITTNSACNQDGVTTFTCSVCGDSYTEGFPHPVYSATEIHDNYVNSVGEIITYDKSGNEYSLGTCFVYTADGRIITNYHVIENSYSAKVTLGGQNYTVNYVLAYDKDIDIAVLKINASNLQPAVICDSSHKVGEVVYAFGNSQGLTSTFSDGMITYSNREIDGVAYVQHDAPISSGNSGGPLINKYGEVIGINTWTLLDSQNLNFAIHVSELDNLHYGSQLTMAQYYEKECSPFLRMKNYIISQGTYDSDGYYCVELGFDYSSDYSYTYSRMAFYYPEENEITLDFLLDDGDDWVYITLTEDLTGVYEWMFYDFANDEYIGGELYARTFTSSTTLSYDTYTYSDYSTLNSARNLARTMIYVLGSYIEEDFYDIGVTAADLQFTCY